MESRGRQHRGWFSPAMFYFAEKTRDTGLLGVERANLMNSDAARLARNRLLPAAMIFGRGIDLGKSLPPGAMTWTGNGKNPVAMMRTSWTDSAAIFVGVKGEAPVTTMAPTARAVNTSRDEWCRLSQCGSHSFDERRHRGLIACPTGCVGTAPASAASRRCALPRRQRAR